MRELTLLAPGLAGAAPPGASESYREGLDLGSLEQGLARADRVAAVPGVEATLRQHFDLPVIDGGGTSSALPVAALTLLNDTGERRAGYWLRADPVHIQAGQDRLIMAGGAGLEIGREEAQALCSEINADMGAEGLHLIAPAAARWYLRWPHAPEVEFSPLPELVGGDIYGHMPGGDAGRPWRRMLNHLQMLLHASAVNERRRAAGRPEINGVWFWGGGELPAVRACRYAGVWSADALARGLAMNAGIQPGALPDDARDWLIRAGPGAHLLVMMDLDESLRLGDYETWRARAQDLHERWFAPLFAALRASGLDKLIVCPADGAEYHITRKTMRRWWRR